jgi:hypothetical protein
MMNDTPPQDLPQPQSGETKKLKVYPAVIAAAIVTWLFSQRGALFGFFFLSLPLLGWMLLTFVRACLDSTRRKTHLARLLVWIIAAVLIVSIHHFRDQAARSYANEVVEKIKTFSATQGHCPKSLEEIGVDKQTFREKLVSSTYSCREGELYLSYANPMQVIDRYSYNFERDVWEYIPD